MCKLAQAYVCLCITPNHFFLHLVHSSKIRKLYFLLRVEGKVNLVAQKKFVAMNLLLIVTFILLGYLPTFRCADSVPKPVINQNAILHATRPIIDDYTFVDKTQFILQLLRDSQERYFFARPRRFGKTVFLRLLQATFDRHRQGEVILRGTNIGNSSHDWKNEKYLVMFFDLNAGTLETAFQEELSRFEEEEKIPPNPPKKCLFIPVGDETDPPAEVQKFHEILCTAVELDCEHRRVVILVDEYDKHILANSNSPERLEAVDHFLRTFFAEIKSSASRIKLAFVTGLTRSSFMLFSSPGGGDFTDISDDVNYAELVGITKRELGENFNAHIRTLAARRNVSEGDIEKELEEWYNSYSFTAALERIYNPMSVKRYFQAGVPKVYWADEGRGGFVWQQMKKRTEDFRGVRDGMTSNLRRMPNVNHAYPETLLFEAGYFSIKEVLPDGSFKVGFSNKEVKEAFIEDRINAAKFAVKDCVEPEIRAMRRALHEPIPDFDGFMSAADTAIMRVRHPYPDEHAYYLHLFYLMRDCNVNARMEEPVQGAEVDLIAETTSTIFHLELKLKRQGMVATWKQATRSTRHFLFRGKNVLTGAILFEGTNVTGIAVSGWNAQLVSEDGTKVIKSFNHSNSVWFSKYIMKKELLKNETTAEILAPIADILQDEDSKYPISFEDLIKFLNQCKQPKRALSIAQEFTSDVPGLITLLDKCYELINNRNLRTRLTVIKKNLRPTNKN